MAEVVQVMVPLILAMMGLLVKLVLDLRASMHALRSELMDRMDRMRDQQQVQIDARVFEATCHERQQACMRLVSAKLDDIRDDQRRLYEMLRSHKHDAENGSFICKEKI